MRAISLDPALRQQFAGLMSPLDERPRRLFAARLAALLGYGGASFVHRLTGVSRRAIRAGAAELRGLVSPAPPGYQRRPGAGRPPAAQQQPGLPAALEALVEPTCRGDPSSPLRWSCKSLRRLAQALRGRGFCASRQTIGALLRQMGYSLQANCKTREGKQHPDRDAQFEFIARRVSDFQARRQPAVSVDTKKELLGDFKNGGREWRPAGRPEEVRVHDFASKGAGKAAPYGVYDLAANEAFVSVGTDHDTSRFAVAAIRSWWGRMGQLRYPQAAQLLITADSGGSNSSRGRLWKLALQELADETGLEVAVSHYPPGTSKWNKIEHRLFSFIAINWRAEPLVSAEALAERIRQTTTRAGLRVEAAVDAAAYPTGVRVSRAEFARVRLRPEPFHGDWNYSLVPHGPAAEVATLIS
jgi:hypothetical protein